MEKEEKISIQINLYWFYLIGFLLIILQTINVLPPWFTPITWGKTIIFRIILSILLFLFICQILAKKRHFVEIKEKIKSIWLIFWLLISFLGINLLATLFSLDANYSLWGSPTRAGGLVNFFFYILFAVFAFLIVRQKDWQKIWGFSIIIGVIVSIVAIIQQFGIYTKFFLPFTTSRPVSTIGNAILLALYLLLLTFPTLTFGLKTKNKVKKILYFFFALLFVFTIVVLTKTRAAFIGLAIGSLWFLFFYPKKLKKVKIVSAFLLLLIIFGAFSLKTYLDGHLDVYQKMPPLISDALDRTLSTLEGTKIIASRISAWKVSLNALKNRPILGYGPENFIIGFDKYYDPSLPIIGYSISGEITEWWDRAHNFIFDISVSAGIPALIIYLSLFCVLFWQLQKTKKNNPDIAPVSHGVQAAFIGYLCALFFGFDSFDTLLISFLLIGYSFYLISNYYPALRIKSESTNKESHKNLIEKIYKWRAPIMIILFVFLVWFIWSYNVKPLRANKDLNLADYYSGTHKCQAALKLIPNITNSKTIIDNYLKQKAVGIIHDCTDETIKPPEDFAKDAIKILKENIQSHPNFLQNWLLLAEYTNILIEEKNKANDDVFVPTEEMKQLRDEANSYFEKARLLSPGRQEVIKEWLKTNILTDEYKKAEEKAQLCIDLNPNYGGCYWLMALVQGYLKDYEKMQHFAGLARERNYNTESQESLPQLINMYIKTNNYPGLADAYTKLIAITLENTKANKDNKAQLYASLATVYKELGEIKKAREAALKALELMPEAKPIVDEFLKSLE